ncbi:MAG TPA: hypothetical protein PLF92_11980 [Arenimonas sp.]|nr:hypothetical protein [Arenimonas sp.]
MRKFIVALLLAAAAAFASGAWAANETVIWENQGLPNTTAIANGQVFPSSAGGATVTVNNALATDGGTIINTIEYRSTTQGNHTGYLLLSLDNDLNDPDDRYTVTLTFSRPVRGLQFTVLDIDVGTGTPLSFVDGVEVFYNGANNVRNTAIDTLGPGVILDDEAAINGYEGNATAAVTSTAGNLDLNFGNILVSTVTITFMSSNDAAANPSLQFIGISDLGFETPASLTARKTWVNATVNDTAVISTTGGTNNVALNSTANSANETDATTAINVYSAEALTFSETLSVPASYTQALACTGNTNALAGAVLTVNAADTAITCTYTNTRRVSDLVITKTNAAGSVQAGGATSYTIRITNNGPTAVTGALLADPAVTGLTVTGVACSATPGQCTGPATPSIAQLQAGNYALPALAVGQFYEITVTANVVATGF